MKIDDLEKIEFSDYSRLNFNHDLSRLNWFNIGGSSSSYQKAIIDSGGRLQIGASNNTGSNTKLVVGAGNNDIGGCGVMCHYASHALYHVHEHFWLLDIVQAHC